MHHMDFPGTATLHPDTLQALAYEVATSLIKHGFRKIVFENGHGGNTQALESAAQRIKIDTGVIGDPTKASKQKGKLGWKIAIERLAELPHELDEIKTQKQ
jgi:creatinine amidohydrolase/Fe(II)-dependent formamide hydrolase-like protein